MSFVRVNVCVCVRPSLYPSVCVLVFRIIPTVYVIPCVVDHLLVSYSVPT